MNTFKNNLKATLYYDMTASDTVIWLNQLVTSSDAPTRLAAWPTCDDTHTFTLTLASTVDSNVLEVVECTGVTANTADYIAFTCTRAKEGTTAIVHGKNTTTVENRLTAAALATIVDAIASVTTTVTTTNTRIDTLDASVSALLAGKANSDLSNATNNAIKYVFSAYDSKTQNTQGGTSASNAWQTRDLNTVDENTLGATLSANRFTLPAGTYRIYASVPGFRCTAFCGALYNVTDGQYTIRGTSDSSGSDATGSSRSFITGKFTISATKTFELRMYTQGSIGTWGLGYATNAASTPEKYSEVTICKV